MIYKFTNRAKKVIEIANDISIELGHNYIGTEHILYGLVKEGEGIASKVLQNKGVTSEKVLKEIKEMLGHGKEIKESLGFTPRSKRVLENAFLEAKRIGYNYIGTEHLLLALMKEGDCIAIKIILELNVEIPQIYNEVAKVINEEEIDKEMSAIAKTGLQEILILTGESRNKSTVEYIGEACKIARKYFKVIGLEVYPVNSDEYAYLHECGADYVTVFQETYNSDKYETLHLAGHKRIYPYRVNAQERALKGGMRGVGFGALLGLDDFRKDAFATGYHAYLLQRKYPHAEIAFSCPRLRPIINNDRINPMDVHEPQLLQVVCAYRLFMPFASITVSTRECERVRDNLVSIAATKISAGVSTGIGSHVEDIEDKGDDQFEISDGRSVDEVYQALLKHNLQPVMSDYIYV